METRRGRKIDLYNSQDNSRRRSMKKKPPRGSWQPTVPAWEKTFCKVVGALDWEIILDMKKFAHLYDNVVKWNDSAGEEAFHNAKKRFLAKMQGVPCDVSLPNPDLYIDEVDWESGVDPELLLDLDREYTVPDTSENHETVVIFGDSLYCNEGFTGTGWGEDEEIFKKATNSSSKNLENSWEGDLCKTKQTANAEGWGEAVQCAPPDEGGGTVGDTGWGDRWETSWFSDQYDHNEIESKDIKGNDNVIVDSAWDFNNEKREDAGGFAARNNTSRFHFNDNKARHKWRNAKGRKKETFIYENSTTWKPMNSCSTLSYHTSGESGQTWKPVL